MSNINQSPGSSSRTDDLNQAKDRLAGAAQDITEQARATAQQAADPARAATQQAAQQARAAAVAAAEQAKAAARNVMDEAGEIAGDAATRAKSFAEENKGKVAEQIDSLGSVLNKAADELENSNQPMIAGYARQLAGGVQSISTTVRDKGIEELFGMVGDFARRQPALFIGGAALLGFVASRFAVSSARSSRGRNWGVETEEQNWAGDRYGSPEIREPRPTSGYGSGTAGAGTSSYGTGNAGYRPGAGSAWGDNPTSNAGSASGTGSVSGASIGGSYGKGSTPNRTGGQWTSTRDTEGGSI